MSESHV